MKYYTIKMNNNDIYGVPAEIIAKNYADFYASKGEDYQENFDAMMNWFDSGSYEFADWARNNMDWDEAKDHAKLLKHGHADPEYQDSWVCGEYRYINGANGD